MTFAVVEGTISVENTGAFVDILVITSGGRVEASKSVSAFMIMSGNI